MIKSISIKHIAFLPIIMVMLFGGVRSASAEGFGVTFQSNPLFYNLNFAPGSSVTRVVTVSNSGPVTEDVYFDTANDYSTGLADVMWLDVTSPSVSFYSGTFTTLFASSEVSLGTLPAGQSRTYIFTATMDSASDNSYQSATMGFDLCVGFSGGHFGCDTEEEEDTGHHCGHGNDWDDDDNLHHGCDQGNYDHDGYDHDGYDHNGYDKNGRDRNGRDHNGYDKEGRDRNGYDRNGRDRDGYDIFGRDQNGNKRDNNNGKNNDRNNNNNGNNSYNSNNRNNWNCSNYVTFNYLHDNNPFQKQDNNRNSNDKNNSRR